MKISSVAEQSGISAKTIRYYESVGLIPPATRTDNGYRAYTVIDVQTLRFIQRARSLGFSVDEVSGLLALWRDRGRASSTVKTLAKKNIESIEQKIRELETMRTALTDLIERCHGDDRPECPIIDELARI